MNRALRTFLPSLAAALFAAVAVVPATRVGAADRARSPARSPTPPPGRRSAVPRSSSAAPRSSVSPTTRVSTASSTSAPGLILVSVQRIGYKAKGDSVRIAAGERRHAQLPLSATVSTLSEVVVTGVTGNTQRRAQAAVVASLPVARARAHGAGLQRERDPAVAPPGRLGELGVGHGRAPRAPSASAAPRRSRSPTSRSSSLTASASPKAQNDARRRRPASPTA